MEMTTHINDRPITRSLILRAIAEFDVEYPDTNSYCTPRCPGWLDDLRYHYALLYHGRLYPPKHIVHLVTGLTLQEGILCGIGSGGRNGANTHLREHGFEVGDKEQLREKYHEHRG